MPPCCRAEGSSASPPCWPRSVQCSPGSRWPFGHLVVGSWSAVSFQDPRVLLYRAPFQKLCLLPVLLQPLLSSSCHFGFQSRKKQTFVLLWLHTACVPAKEEIESRPCSTIHALSFLFTPSNLPAQQHQMVWCPITLLQVWMRWFSVTQPSSLRGLQCFL